MDVNEVSYSPGRPLDRSQFHYVGKALEAEASDLGLPAPGWPIGLALTGLGVGETMFWFKKLGHIRGRSMVQYESTGGRLLRILIPEG